MPKRFSVLSIPTDDGGAFWFLYDRKERTSRECNDREEARQAVCLANLDN